MADGNFILTQEGKDKLEEELHFLETEKRAEIGERIVGLGTTHGGAHANNRWTTFTGTTTAVTDLDQPFDVFHGWGAGQLVAAVLSGDQPVIVGSWQSPIAGNDVAVWLLDGSRWTRRDSAGTPLA